MKRILIAISAAIALASCGTGNKAPSPTPQMLEAEEQGRVDADKVINSKPGTMERERSIIAIRVKEHQIRMAGDTVLANCYLRAAEARLDSAGIIKSN